MLADSLQSREAIRNVELQQESWIPCKLRGTLPFFFFFFSFSSLSSSKQECAFTWAIVYHCLCLPSSHFLVGVSSSQGKGVPPRRSGSLNGPQRACFSMEQPALAGTWSHRGGKATAGGRRGYKPPSLGSLTFHLNY